MIKIYPLFVLSLILVLSSSLFCSFDVSASIGVSESSKNSEEWVYYGFVPRINYTLGYASSLNNATWLSIIGYNDSTQVSIYDITEGKNEIIESFSINRLESHTLQISSLEANFSAEQYFKVVSNNPIGVFMYGGINYIGENSETWGVSLFYPSTDGGFAGKEFIFLSAQSASLIRRKGLDYVVFGIDESDVKVEDAKGNVIMTKHVAANSSKRIPLHPSRIYRITSTGRIMVSTWSPSTLTVLPSPMGGYMGTFFFANPDVTERPYHGSAIILAVAQEKPSKIQIIDMSTGSKVKEKQISSRGMWFISREEADLTGKKVKVTGSAPLLVYAGATSITSDLPDTIDFLSHGIFFIGIHPDTPTTLYIPSRGIIFSPDSNAEVKVNGIPFRIKKGSYKDIPVGKVTLNSNATLIVEVISNPETVDYMKCFGSYLPSSRTIEITYPPPKAEKPSEGGFNIILYAGVAAAVAIAAVAVIVFKRKL